MFHKIKKIFLKLYTRTKALITYLIDYPIAGVSLLYFLLQPLTILLSRTVTIGWGIYITFTIILLIIYIFLIIVKKEIFLTKFLLNKEHNKANKIITLLLVALLVILLQLLRLSPIITTEREMGKKTKSFTKGSTTIDSYLSQELDGKYSYVNSIFSVLQVVNADGQNIQTKPFKVLVKIPKFQKIAVGQLCKLEGQLVEPKNSENFNYKNFLKNKGVYFLMEFPQITCIDISEKRGGFFLRNILLDIKEKIVRKIEFVLSEPQTSLLVGILFGSDRLFSKDFENNLRVAGVSHIISASGYNITVLAILLNRIFSFLLRKYRIILILIVIWCFAIFSGLSASIIRACIMASISNIAIIFGRLNSSHISLLLTATIFLVINPLTIYDVGFQLSISAMIGLLYISPILEKFLPKSDFFKEFITPTMSCTLSTIPVSLFTFKTISIWSIPANVMLLPVIGSTMIIGVFALLLQPVITSISYLLFNIINVQLRYFEKVVNIIGKSNIGIFTIQERLATILTTIFMTLLILLTISLYPLDNENSNYYLKEKLH